VVGFVFLDTGQSPARAEKMHQLPIRELAPSARKEQRPKDFIIKKRWLDLFSWIPGNLQPVLERCTGPAVARERIGNYIQDHVFALSMNSSFRCKLTLDFPDCFTYNES